LMHWSSSYATNHPSPIVIDEGDKTL
jgi:hypothetical protein